MMRNSIIRGVVWLGLQARGALVAVGLLAAAPAAATLIDLGNVTRDTATNLDWLDLTLTSGQSPQQVLDGYGGYIASGYRVASWTEVNVLAQSAGLPGLGGSDTSLYSQTQALVSLLGPTYGDGVTQSGIQGLAFDQSFGRYRDPSFAWAEQGDGSYLGYSSTCCGNYVPTASFGGVGVYLVRDTPPQPPIASGQIRYSGAGTGDGYIDRVSLPDIPFSNYSFSFEAVGNSSNYFDDLANNIRIIPIDDVTLTFSGPFGSVSPEISAPDGQRVLLVGLGERSGTMAFGDYEGGAVQMGAGFSGAGLVDYDGLTALGVTPVTVDGDVEFDLANGATWYFTNLSSLTVSANILGLTDADPFLPAPSGPTGRFVFDVDVQEGVTYFFDPLIAIGYDYLLGDDSPLITKALLPVIGNSRYGIFALNDLNNPLFSDIVGGTTIDFRTLAAYADGIRGFALRGIDVAAELDPNDPLAFVTGLTFAEDGQVSLQQVAVSVEIGVPEPSSWAMMVFGFGLLGAAMRGRSVRLATA